MMIILAISRNSDMLFENLKFYLNLVQNLLDLEIARISRAKWPYQCLGPSLCFEIGTKINCRSKMNPLGDGRFCKPWTTHGRLLPGVPPRGRRSIVFRGLFWQTNKQQTNKGHGAGGKRRVRSLKNFEQGVLSSLGLSCSMKLAQIRNHPPSPLQV